MPNVSFDDLYSDDKTSALGVFLLWTNDFIDGFGATSITVDADQAYSFVSNLRKEEFPANGGFEAASPFKKAANIYVWLHALNPFKSPFSASVINPSLAKFSSLNASIVGYNLVKSCLHNATLTKATGVVTLSNPIQVSNHYFTDLVEASDGIAPSTHFKMFSLLFEALVYQTNDVSYPRIL